MRCLPLFPVLLLSQLCAANADDNAQASLTIRNRAFEPTELQVPAGRKIELHVKNADSSPSEFESAELHREKVVPAGQEIVVYIGPLRAGSYEFFDDFNPRARGHIVAK